MTHEKQMDIIYKKYNINTHPKVHKRICLSKLWLREVPEKMVRFSKEMPETFGDKLIKLFK